MLCTALYTTQCGPGQVWPEPDQTRVWSGQTRPSLAWSGQTRPDWVCAGYRPSSGLWISDPGSGLLPDPKKKRKREKERKEKEKGKEKRKGINKIKISRKINVAFTVANQTQPITVATDPQL